MISTRTNRTIVFIASLALAGLALPALCAPGPSAKFGSKWQALIGEWKGEGDAGGGGVCGFHFDLSERVIVRTNRATLAATGGRPAGVHEDLMVLYPGAAEDKAKASYFDNEGHVIEYDGEWAPDGATLTFLSKPGMGPQFRLIYKRVDAKTFTVGFEMKPPGQSAFTPYTSGTIKRGGG
jgi:hypothetical protein